MGKGGKIRRCGEGREGSEVWGREGRYGGVGKGGKVRRCGEGREGTEVWGRKGRYGGVGKEGKVRIVINILKQQMIMPSNHHTLKRTNICNKQLTIIP